MSALTTPALTLQRVDADGWRDACLELDGPERRFEGLFAASGGARALFRGEGGAAKLLVCEEPGAELETIVDRIPAAGWDERLAHDQIGLRFAGHEPLRALLDHGAALADWTVPVSGTGVHQIAVGPVHAGIIESGHFRFHVVGERILHLDARLFYKHRGLERAAAGCTLADGLAYAARACAACAVANTVAYVQAAEQCLGLAVDEPTRRARTVLLELERLYNHMHDISAICAGVGFAAGSMAYAAFKERAQRLNERLCGHRFLFGTVAIGDTPLALYDLDHAAVRDELQGLRREHEAAWRELLFATSFQARLDGVGVLTRADAERLGAVGPAARASGLHIDQRGESPGLLYAGMQPAVADDAGGDVRSRTAQRALELEQTFTLLDELLARPAGVLPPAGARPRSGGDGVRTGGLAGAAAAGGHFGAGRVESPRGRTVCLLEQEHGRVRALHLRTGSYANWPVLAHAVPGNLVPDFPLINKSFELCYACADR